MQFEFLRIMREYNYICFTKINNIMERKNYPTIVFVASRLQERNFSAISKDVVAKFTEELSDFTVMAYKKYHISGDGKGFWNCRECEKWFFESLVVVAKFLPDLLNNDDLREFLGFMYHTGLRFNGMVPVLEACGLTKQYLASFAHLYVHDEGMRDWIIANWNFLMPNMALIQKELRRKRVKDMRFDILNSGKRQALLIAAVAFALGVIVGVSGIIMVIA